MSVRHLLSFVDYSPEELAGLIRRGNELKDLRNRGMPYEPPKSRVLGMVFERASTRIRLSFETGMVQLGGQTILLPPRDIQSGRGEPIGDSAQVISRVFSGVMIRTFAYATLTEFATYSKAPVIDDLSDGLHPRQLSTGMQTFHEYCDNIQGKTVAQIDDGNNMCNSYIEAALRFDFQLHVACPEGYELKAKLVALANGRLRAVRDPREVAANVHLVSTSVWALMSRENKAAVRIALFHPYQVSVALLDGAADDVLLMHCLPTHRGEETSEELLDDSRSVAWGQAENRLHAQKVLLELLTGHVHYA